jgi:hypothetical protein
MKHIALFISTLYIMMTLSLSVSALDMPSNLQVSEITQDSATVSWDVVEESLGYVISYGIDASSLNLG